MNAVGTGRSPLTLSWPDYSSSANYDARHLMTAMSVSGSMLGFSYSHDANGRVTGITDNVVAGQNRSFGYDGLGRLATASGPWDLPTPSCAFWGTRPLAFDFGCLAPARFPLSPLPPAAFTRPHC